MAKPRSGVRVIAGSARGRRLETPPGLATRPITDRVKESVFGSLQPDLPDARVLDLYAGSGAMGIEALSRGAASAVFVERHRATAALIRRNLETTGMASLATVHSADVSAFVKAGAPEPFDVVFCDPPYDLPTPEVDGVLAALARGWVVPDALVVLRRRAGDAEVSLPAAWAFARRRTFGDTLVLVASVGDAPEQEP